MKKTICLILFFAFLSTTVIAQGSTTSYHLQVSFTTNPTIITPGTSGYIEVNLKNIGSGTLNNIDIDVVRWDSSTIIKNGDWDIIIDDLGSGDETTALYEFSIPDTSTPGLYQVVFEITSSAGTNRQSAMIRVEDTTVLDIVSAYPSFIDIGEETTIVFNVTNNGGININNLIFTWEDSNDVIIPVGSDNRQIISSIPADNYSNIKINVMASPSATPGVYPLSITMQYYDNTGTQQTTTSEAGFQVGGTTDFEITIQQSTGGSTTFSITNIGANVASSLIVSIPDQANYRSSGVSSSSLGNLDPGDYTLATFQIQEILPLNENDDQTPSFPRQMNNVNSNSNKLKVDIAYTDYFGVRQTTQKEITYVALAGGSSSMSSDFSGRFDGMGGEEESEGSDEATNYIIIGVIGIVIIIVLLQIAKRKKPTQFSKEKSSKSNKDYKNELSTNNIPKKESTKKQNSENNKVFTTKKGKSAPAESDSSAWEPIPVED